MASQRRRPKQENCRHGRSWNVILDVEYFRNAWSPRVAIRRPALYACSFRMRFARAGCCAASQNNIDGCVHDYDFIFTCFLVLIRWDYMILPFIYTVIQLLNVLITPLCEKAEIACECGKSKFRISGYTFVIGCCVTSDNERFAE